MSKHLPLSLPTQVVIQEGRLQEILIEGDSHIVNQASIVAVTMANIKFNLKLHYFSTTNLYVREE